MTLAARQESVDAADGRLANVALRAAVPGVPEVCDALNCAASDAIIYGAAVDLGAALMFAARWPGRATNRSGA